MIKVSTRKEEVWMYECTKTIIPENHTIIQPDIYTLFVKQ